MSVLYLVIPLALILAGTFLAGFIWAVRQGQMDDVDTPRYRAIQDDD
jgi:cbb3-type cytochrome oxidase maturation protein